MLIMATGILTSWYLSGDFAYTRCLWYWTVYFVIVSLLVDRARRKLTNSLNTSNNLPKYRTQNHRQVNSVSPPSRPNIPIPPKTNAQKPTPPPRPVPVPPNRHSNTGVGETNATNQATPNATPAPDISTKTREHQTARPIRVLTPHPKLPVKGISKINVAAPDAQAQNTNTPAKTKAPAVKTITPQKASMPRNNNNNKVTAKAIDCISFAANATPAADKDAILAACKAAKIDTTRNRGANFTPPVGVEFQIDSFTAATFEIPAKKDSEGNIIEKSEKRGWLRINVVANGQLYAISLTRIQGALFGAAYWNKKHTTKETEDELNEVASKYGLTLDVDGNSFAVVNLNGWEVANVPNDFGGAIDYLIEARRNGKKFVIVATEEQVRNGNTFKTSCIITK